MTDKELDQLVDNYARLAGYDAKEIWDNLAWPVEYLRAGMHKCYTKKDLPEGQEVSETDSDLPELVSTKELLPTDHGLRKAGVKRSRLCTVEDSISSESSDDEHTEACYPLDSEHRGSLSRKKKIVSRAKARKIVEDYAYDPAKPSCSSGREYAYDPAKPSCSSGQESFSRTGYSLGQSQSDSQEMPCSSSHEDPHSSFVMLKLWREGFNFNDGPLRTYDDPENKQFLDSVHQGLIPPELRSNVGKAVVQLKFEDHGHESFHTFQAPGPSSGQGHILGGPMQAFVHTETSREEEPQWDMDVETPFEVDDTKPE